MALQEKEFVVKNGLDIKNSTLKLNGVLPSTNQFPVRSSSGILTWAEIKSGQGISVTQNDTQILIASSGTVPGDVTNIGDLTIGANATWTSSGSSVTVTKTSHNLIAGNAVYLIWSGTNKPTDGYYTVSSVTTDTFVLPISVAVNGSSQNCTIGGNITAKRSLTVGLDLIAGRDLSVTGVATIGNTLTITGTPNIVANTGASNVTMFTSTTGQISFGTASNVLTIGSSASNTTFNGTIIHKGVTLQYGVQSYQKVD
mgnify:FL=1